MGDISVGNLIVNVATKLADFKKGITEVEGKFGGLKDKAEQVRSGINKMGLVAAAAGAAIAAGLAAGVTATAKLGDSIDKMSGRTGIAAEKLSGFAFVAERSGTSLQSVEVAIRRTQRNLSDASKGIGTAKDALESLGIATKNADGSLRDAVDVMIEFSDKTLGMEDSSKKAALAQEIFGRAGTELLPMFNSGSEGINAMMQEAEKFGIVMDNNTALMGADAVDAMTNFQTSIKGATMSLTTDLLPIVTTVLNMLADAVSSVSSWLREHKTQMMGAVEFIINDIIFRIIDGWINIYKAIDDAFDAAIVIATTGIEKIYNSFKWLLDKLGIELPDISELFDDIRETGESGADKLAKKWGEFKDTFNQQLDETKKRYEQDSNERIKTTENEVSEYERIREEQVEAEAQLRKEAQEEEREDFAFHISKMLEDEEEKKDEQRAKEREKTEKLYESLTTKYGEHLTAEELKHAETLIAMGEDWETYAKEAAKPGKYQQIWNTFTGKWNEAIDTMGSAWIDSLANGGKISNAFDFTGEYLKRSLQAGLMDVAGSILDNFIKTIKDKLLGSGIANITANIFSGGSSGSAIGGAAGTAGGITQGGGTVAGVGTALAPIAIVAGIGLGVKAIFDKFSNNDQHDADRAQGHEDIDSLISYAERYGGVNTYQLANMSQSQAYNFLNQQAKNGRTSMFGNYYRMLAIQIGLNKLLSDPGIFQAGMSVDDLTAYGASTEKWKDFYELGVKLSRSADRYHVGGIVPGTGEKLAILQGQEEVLTRDNPRHAYNFGNGITVNLYGVSLDNTTNVQKLARQVGKEIMMELKHLTAIPMR